MQKQLYCVNGFYLGIRKQFLEPNAQIAYFVCEWDQDKLNFKDFVMNITGETNPQSAKEGSMRNYIWKNYRELGLTQEPSIGDNSIHASSSPFETVAEKANWLNSKIKDDPFAKILMDHQISEENIKQMFNDPKITLPNSKKAYLFRKLENLNADKCIQKMLEMQNIQPKSTKFNLKNQVFLFIKPHAINDKVIKYVEEKLKKEKINIIKKGRINSKEIEKRNLIDTHYGSIYQKAMILKPEQLQLRPEVKNNFQYSYGISWKEALNNGQILNAVDVMQKMKLDLETFLQYYKDKQNVVRSSMKHNGDLNIIRIIYNENSSTKDKIVFEKQQSHELYSSGSISSIQSLEPEELIVRQKKQNNQNDEQKIDLKTIKISNSQEIIGEKLAKHQKYFTLTSIPEVDQISEIDFNLQKSDRERKQQSRDSISTNLSVKETARSECIIYIENID